MCQKSCKFHLLKSCSNYSHANQAKTDPYLPFDDNPLKRRSYVDRIYRQMPRYHTKSERRWRTVKYSIYGAERTHNPKVIAVQVLLLLPRQASSLVRCLLLCGGMSYGCGLLIFLWLVLCLLHSRFWRLSCNRKVHYRHACGKPHPDNSDRARVGL